MLSILANKFFCWNARTVSPPPSFYTYLVMSCLFGAIYSSQLEFFSWNARTASPPPSFYTYLVMSCLFGTICSSRLEFFSWNARTAGDGLLVKAWMIPAGNENITSPVILTKHLEIKKSRKEIGRFHFVLFNFFMMYTIRRMCSSRTSVCLFKTPSFMGSSEESDSRNPGEQ